MKKDEGYLFKIIGFGILAVFIIYVFSYNQDKRNKEEIKYKKQYVENMDISNHFYTMEDDCLDELKENFIPKNEDFNYDRFCEDERERAEQGGYDLVQHTVDYLQDFDINDYKDETFFYKP
jgi:hypothetical protein